MSTADSQDAGASTLRGRLRQRRLHQRMFGRAGSDLRVGRYSVERTLGERSMGVVYLAIDTTLNRPVALKVLHRRAGEGVNDRLAREANALARLRHPNVVSVYEFGTASGTAFVATEYVEGATLRAWLEHESPDRRSIIKAFAAACAGLAAAHDAGLVHRDFKPANVMRANDGRVQVVDFGLAEPADAGDGVRRETASARDSAETSSSGPGAVVVAGTRRYMPPEQYAGARPRPEADVYAWCLSLVEALGAQLPRGDALYRAKCEGTIAPPRSMPWRLRRVVRQGLRVDPRARFANGAALLAAVEDATRSRVALVGVVALVAVAGATVATTAWSVSDAGCPPDTPVWTDERADQVAAAWAVHDDAFRERAWGALRERLNEYASQVAEYRAEVCTRPAKARAEHLDCIEGLRDHIGALTPMEPDRGLLGTDPVFWVGDMARDLSAPAEFCESDRGNDPTLADHGRVDLQVRVLLARGEAQAARDRLADALANARAVGDHGAQARLLLLDLVAQLHLGEPQAVWEQTLTSALAAAERSGDPNVRIRVLAACILEFGAELGDAEAAERFIAQGRGLIAHNEVSAAARDRFEFNLAQLRANQGQEQEATTILESMLARDDGDPRGPQLRVLTVLASLDVDAGRYAEAARHLDAAEAIDDRRNGGGSALGPYLLNIRGQLAMATHQAEAAIRYYREAAEAWRQINGKQTSGAALENLGRALLLVDRSEAATTLRRALADRSRQYGSDHAVAQELAVWVAASTSSSDPLAAAESLATGCAALESNEEGALLCEAYLLALGEADGPHDAAARYLAAAHQIGSSGLHESQTVEIHRGLAQYCRRIGDRVCERTHQLARAHALRRVGLNAQADVILQGVAELESAELPASARGSVSD